MTVSLGEGQLLIQAFETPLKIHLVFLPTHSKESGKYKQIKKLHLSFKIEWSQ